MRCSVSMKDFVEQFDFLKKRLSKNRRRSPGGLNAGGHKAAGHKAAGQKTGGQKTGGETTSKDQFLTNRFIFQEAA